ncbi:MAG: glycosyltransferase, partial [Bacteroidia bacterium]|nr:glycosyltransferase [Bacteroidia bacterium]
MKVSHVISSIDKGAGGPSRSVTMLIEHLLILNHNLTFQIFTLKSRSPMIKSINNIDGEIKFHSSLIGSYSTHLKQALTDSKTDVFHGHGLWQWPVHQMAKTARNKNMPYVISPRGMLDVWPMQHKAFKKKLALWLFQHNDIKKATVIHATSESEANNIRNLGYTNPIAVIPNGVVLPAIKPISAKKNGQRSVLFMSRLVKNKGIEELINVWSQISTPIKSNWKLVIIGDGEPKYVEYLKKMVRQNQLTHVEFLGGLYGDSKQRYLDEADLFVLPTYTENFGIAIAEALASYT